MKKVVVSALGILMLSAGSAQTIISYGNNKVSKEAFLRAYNKNKNASEDKSKAVREYAELYANFKLKVQAAKDLGIDTSIQIANDLSNFRREIEENYVNDERAFNTLMNEAFARSQSDIRVYHYTLPVEAGLSPADTLKKYQTIKSFLDELKKNSNAIVPDPVKFNDLGFITVFTLPYKFETAVYETKVGETSGLMRTKSGWHIFKVVDKRPAAGKWKVAQLLFTFPPNPDEKSKANAKQLADSVYALLKAGADFATMARNVSEDKLTYLNGGELPEFGTGKFNYEFEKEVFNLRRDGDITTPFATSFGYHIVKRLGFTPTPSSSTDEALQYELKNKLMKDNRIKSAKDRFAKEIEAKVGFKMNAKIVKSDLMKYADSVIENPASNLTEKLPISNKTLFSFAKNTVNGKKWLEYIREYKANSEVYRGESNEEIWNNFLSASILEYYKKHLEDFSPEFAYQIQEFKEGNMLFEVMEKEVWSKASSDTAGLEDYYNRNKSKYKWGASAEVLMMNCATSDIAKETIDQLKAGKNWMELMEAKPGDVQGDSLRIELAQLTNGANARPNSFSEVTVNADGSASFVRYYNLHEAGEQRSFEEARALITNDYQSEVENKWLESLRKKYPVTIQESVLQEIIKSR